MYGIRISVVIGFIIYNGMVFCQKNCLDINNTPFSDDCGELKITTSNSEFEFCEGFEGKISIDPNLLNVFDSFFIYWCDDGEIDSFSNTQYEFRNTYDFPDDVNCGNPFRVIQIDIIAKKNCQSGVSFANAATKIKVNKTPIPKFNFNKIVCISDSILFDNKSCYATSYLWDFGDGMTSMKNSPKHQYKNTGKYKVKLIAFNQCGSNTLEKTLEQDIEVIGYPNAIVDVSQNAKDSVVCLNERVTFIDKSNIWSQGNVWTYPNGNNPHKEKTKWKILTSILKKDSLSFGKPDSVHFIDTIVLDFLQAGQYIFSLKSSNKCADSIWTFPINVEIAPTVNLSGDTICDTKKYKPTFTINGNTLMTNWSFPGGMPSSSSNKDPGLIMYPPGNNTYKVILDVKTNCGNFHEERDVVVVAQSIVTINDPKIKYCKGGDNDTLTANESGGTWSGIGIIDSKKGIFSPKNLNKGIYKIKYKYGIAGCESEDEIEIEVVDAEVVIVDNETKCEDSPPFALTASLSGGTWSGKYISQPNLFHPDSSGVGTFKVFYSRMDANGCKITKEAEITIQKLPTFSIKVNPEFCLDGGLINLSNELVDTVIPYSTNTVFYIDNMQVPNNYNLASLSTGQHTVIAIHTQGECVVSDTGSINIKQKQILTLSPDDTVCINDKTYQLTANVTPGTWSGTGVNPTTGVIDLSVGVNGNGVYNYIAFPMSSCEVRGSVKIKINDPANTLSVGADTSFCFGPTNARFFGSPSNGTWTGPSINPSGVIDLTALKTDTTYSFEYCINDNAVNNCQACKSKKLTIHSLPQPAFTIDSTTCVNEIITFTNTTAQGTYLISSVKWDFDNGKTSNSYPIAINTYDAKGTYNVSLTLTNVYDCSNTYFQAIKVTTKPEIDFEVNKPPSPCAPYTISAINTTTSDEAFTSYWTLNGKRYDTHDFGPITIDSLLDVTNYTLSLFTTNDCGELIKSTNFIVNPYPRANFGLSYVEGCSPLKIDFSNTTKGRPKSFMWDLGNGKMVNDSLPPSQTYTTTDSAITIYHIRLIAKNDCGNDTIDRTVKVYPPNVRAFIESQDDKVCQYDSLSFIAFSTVGAANTWQVIAPSGMISGAAGDTATIKFNESGSYKILLFAANCGVHSDSTFVDVLAAPLVDFKIPDFVCVNDTVSFINTSVNIGNSEWDFGDSNMSTVSNPKHVYDTPGNYTVKLKAWSSPDYCPNVISKEITIVGKPISSFIADTMNGCQPLLIQFTNQSVGGLHSVWNFGDNTGNSTDASPKHTFDQSGTFKVKLTVFDANNCFTDTSIANIIVHPKPKADFSFENKDYCLGYDSIDVHNISTEAVGYIWKFQSNIDTVIENAFFPTAYGNHNIELIATSDHNCKDTLIKNVLILASPIADFEVNNNSGCEDLEVVFENKSSNSDRFIWNFGNNVTSVNKDTTYIYNIHGQYNASLISINDNGCPNDTITRTITVHPKPVAGFSFQKDKECGVPMNVTFSNNSTFYNDAEWLINGSSLSQDFNLNYVFNNDQKYNVDLIVENEYFCKDTIGKEVDIYLQPIAAFEVTDKTCEREEVIIENLSTYANAYEWTIDTKGMTNVESPSVVFEEAGSYNINLIAIYNEFCKDTFRTIIPIQVFTKPTADFDYYTGYNNNIKGEAQFTDKSIDYTSLLWHFGDGYSSDSLNPMHEYDINRPIEVQLNAYHENNGLHICIDSISKVIEPEWIKTFYAPNALVPDHGDDLINKFKPVGIGIKNYHISIFSPWGEKVWESNKLDENGSPTGYWDGKYQDKIVPQGAYTWRADITWEDGNVEKVMVGSVIVIR